MLIDGQGLCVVALFQPRKLLLRASISADDAQEELFER
jgi:hypothetical protein